MPSSIPAVIDYLLDKAIAAAGDAGGDEIAVDDGWPEEVAERMFGVGIDKPPDAVDPAGEEASGTQGILTLGNLLLEEGFGVPNYIYDGTGGTNQKTCRDAAFDIFNPFMESLRDDPSMGGRCLVSVIGNLAITGPRTAQEAARGRFCLIQFVVVCKSVI